MQMMIDFSTALLSSVADFLGSEPMIYLFAIVCLCGIVQAVKLIIN